MGLNRGQQQESARITRCMRVASGGLRSVCIRCNDAAACSLDTPIRHAVRLFSNWTICTASLYCTAFAPCCLARATEHTGSIGAALRTTVHSQHVPIRAWLSLSSSMPWTCESTQRKEHESRNDDSRDREECNRCNRQHVNQRFTSRGRRRGRAIQRATLNRCMCRNSSCAGWVSCTKAAWFISIRLNYAKQFSVHSFFPYLLLWHKSPATLVCKRLE